MTCEQADRTILASHEATQDKPAASGRQAHSAGELHGSDENKRKFM